MMAKNNDQSNRPYAVCKFSDTECDKYFRVLNRSYNKALAAQALVGIDFMTIVEFQQNVKIIILSECGTKEGPLSDADVLYARNISSRKRGWRQSENKNEMTSLQLLQAMTLIAKRQNRCYDIFIQGARLRSSNMQHDTYGNKGWEGTGKESNLAYTQIELQGCMDQSRSDPNLSKQKRSHCPLGCTNVRVHSFDIRPPVESAIEHEQMAEFQEHHNMQEWLEFFICSRDYFQDDPEKEEQMWKRYREAVYPHLTETQRPGYIKYREAVRTQGRSLLEKIERKFVELNPMNADGILVVLRLQVINAHRAFCNRVLEITNKHRTNFHSYKLTWFMVSSVTMIYYTVLRLWHVGEATSSCPPSESMSATIQMDTFFQAPLLSALRNCYHKPSQSQPDDDSGINSIPIILGQYTYVNDELLPTPLDNDEFSKTSKFGTMRLQLDGRFVGSFDHKIDNLAHLIEVVVESSDV